MIKGKSTAFKNELLFEQGINFNKLPNWQKRGTGFYWQEVEKVGWNPVKKEEVLTKRRAITVDFDLPMKEEYSHFVERIISGAASEFMQKH